MRRSIFAVVTLCACISLCIGLCAFPSLVFAQAPVAQGIVAQANVAPARITQAIDEANLTQLRGNTHPLAQARFDQGAAPDSLPMQRMLLVLKRSADQEAALDALLDQQQDSTSANFHQWLTPQQFGQQFGPSDQDIQTITNWLQSQGFTVAGVSNGRTVIEFSGTAGQVRQSFHTEIHRYTINAQDHWANASDPQIPAALTPVVAGIEALNSFPKEAMYQAAGVMTRSQRTGALEPVSPLFTLSALPPCGVPGVGCYGVGPYDFATIYDVLPLWNAASPIDGTGQTIAIVGETDINLQDVQSFRSFFGLPANTPTVIVNGPDPGTIQGEETESDLDVEWSGAVAKGATIDFVTSQSTSATAGIDLSAEYIVDNNLAPILSESYGQCELFMGQSGNAFFNGLWQQAAAQGITVLIASGDSGSAVCDRQDQAPPDPAINGLAVSGFSSTPYNVAVGGTDFNDLTNPSLYWSATNTAPPGNTGAPATISALSYIPETTWNNSCTNSVLATLGFSTNPATNCNNPQLITLVAANGGSGGKSNCTTPSGPVATDCSGGYPKPSWQSAPGVPNDSHRDVPDVSLYAAVNSPSGAFYLICEADITPGPSCSASDPTNIFGIGGTSASAPAFAGIMALVDQQTDTRQGNANYVLYKLASQHSNAIHDTPAGGTIAMPCASGSPNCTTPGGDIYGVLSGYSTTAGYDLATGLGSVDANNLVTSWASANTNLKASTTTLTLSGAPVNITHGQSVQVTVAVSGSGGTPTGSVSLIANTPNGPETIATAELSAGSASFTTNTLPGGNSYTVFAKYPGDGTFHSSSSTAQSVSVAPEASKILLSYNLLNASGGVANSNVSTAAFGTPALLQINVTSQSGNSCSNNTPGSTGCPTGTITLTDNGTPLNAGSYTLNSQGSASDQAIYLTPGTHALAATYSGDNNYTAGPQALDTITVTKAPTTISFNSSPPSGPALGSPIELTAVVNTQVVSPPAGFLPSTATGTVTFLAGGAPIAPGPNATVSYNVGFQGQTVQLYATLTISSLPIGENTITAQYNGDQNYAPSGPSSAQQFTVRMTTTTSLSSSNPNPVAGTSVNFTSTVTPTQYGAAAPSGSVAINSPNYGGLIGSGSLSGNQAQSSIVMPAGTIQMQAFYQGDANNAPSASAPLTEAVTPISTSMTLTSSAPSSQVGVPVMFTATINSTPAAGPPAGGVVGLTTGNIWVGGGTVSNGQASFAALGLPAGTDNVVATYTPDAYRSPSTTSIQETVSKGALSISVTSSQPTIVVGSFVVFNAAVQIIQGAPFPTGTVQFTVNGVPFGGPINMPGTGLVGMSTASLPLGTVTIAANYSGDSNYSASSGTFGETVNPAPSFSVTASPASLTISQPGQSATTTLTFTSQGNLTGSSGFANSTCGTSFSEEITCSLTNFTLPANGTATATLTFTSTAATSSLPPGARHDRFAFGTHSMRFVLIGLLVFMIVLAFAARHEDRRWRLVFGMLLFAVIASGVSCGGGSGSSNNPPPNPGTPAGNVSPLSVSITINGVTQTVPNLTLTVN